PGQGAGHRQDRANNLAGGDDPADVDRSRAGLRDDHRGEAGRLSAGVFGPRPHGGPRRGGDGLAAPGGGYRGGGWGGGRGGGRGGRIGGGWSGGRGGRWRRLGEGR